MKSNGIHDSSQVLMANINRHCDFKLDSFSHDKTDAPECVNSLCATSFDLSLNGSLIPSSVVLRWKFLDNQSLK